MKIFTKVMLIIAAVFASVGVICMVVAFAMGLTTDHLTNIVQNGYVSFDAGDLHFSFGEDQGDEILGTEVENGETTVYEIKETCKSMDIDFGAGILDIYYDDVECIQVKENNITGLRVNVKNDILHIGMDEDIYIDIDDIDDRSLTIIIPTEMQFEEVDMEIGASQADIKDIKAESISIVVGVGQADISRITSKEFDLEVGTGQATAVQLSVDKLDVEAGLGQVNIALNGVQEDYNYNVDCGIGSVVVGKSSYGGLGAEQNVRNEGATKEINVDCGIGEVVIIFKE